MPHQRSLNPLTLLTVATLVLWPLAVPSGSPAAAPAAAPREVTILASGSIQGELEICGCRNHPRGGLARRSAYYTQTRRDHPNVVTLDAGDFALPPGDPDGRTTTEFLARALNKLHYDAWTPGERELSYDTASLRALSAALGCEPVSANLADASGRLLFRDHVVKSVGGIRVGVTGVTTGDFLPAADSTMAPALAAVRFKDTVESLTPVVAELRRQSDVVILLAHMRGAEARNLAEMIPGIDVVVVGHNPPFVDNLVRVGETLLVEGGNHGYYATQVSLTLDAAPTGGGLFISDYGGSVDPLGETAPVDSLVSGEVTQFLAGLKAAAADSVARTGGGGSITPR